MITEASAFASIVGLLSAFSSGRESRSTAELTEFVAWLIDHNHQELAKFVEQNLQTSTSIKALLSQQNSEVHRKLDEMGHLMAILASRMPDLSEVASSVVPNVELSDQAHAILVQMQKNGTEFFLVSNSLNAAPQLVPSNGPAITYSEQQFLHDDLGTLVGLGLLRLNYNAKGSEMYYFTRAGAQVAKIQR